MIQDSDTENEDGVTNSLPLFNTASRTATASPSPVHVESKPPLADNPPNAPFNAERRPSHHIDSEFAKVKLSAALCGSVRSLSSAHSMESFELSGGVDVDDDDRLLYLLCARCIAFPFTAKYQLETVPPKPKLNLTALEKLRTALMECADNGTIQDQAELTTWERKYAQNANFQSALRWYVSNVLDSRWVVDLCSKGALSCRELENIFEAHVRTRLVRQEAADSEMRYFLTAFTKLIEFGSQLPHHSYALQTPVVGGSTLSTADQERLYTTFQKILNVPSSKHKSLCRICQFGNTDEQEAVVRKELLRRKENLNMARFQIGGSRQIQEMYKDVQNKLLSYLTSSLDSRAFAKPTPQAPVESNEPVVIKQDLKLSFKLHLTIHEVTLMTIPPDIKPVFCVFRIVNTNESLATHHEQVILQTKCARFDQIAEFNTGSPLPQIEFELHMESKSFLRESKVLARKVHTLALLSSSDTTEWVELEEKGVIAKLKISVFCDRPNNVKKHSFLLCKGNLMFKKWKKRFLVLLQLSSQYKFLLCAYKPMETTPNKQVLLDGYTVEYLSREDGEANKEFDAESSFQLVSEKGTIRICCKDRSERDAWVQWMTRATGQENKLDPSGESQELDKYAAIKDIVSIDVTELDHNKLFAKLFGMILNYQLKEPLYNRGLFSPGQLFVTDEYCSRYCVRDCTRHIICMQQWLKAEEMESSIWPLMLYSSFRFVQMHVAGKKPNDRSVFVIEEERDALVSISHQIAELAMSKIERFRHVFPFGQPKDDLKMNIKLLNIVSCMQPGQSEKDMSNNTALVSCIERAALVNYQEIYQSFVNQHPDQLSTEEYLPLPPTLMLELIQKCIDYMYELHDYYLDEFMECHSVLRDHIEAFWSFLFVDLQECLKICNDIISKIQLFHIINQYFCSQPTLKCCKFHTNMLELFGPIIEEYIGCIGDSLTSDLTAALNAEDWLPSQHSGCCSSVEGCVVALSSLDSFVVKLAWPVENFSLHLQGKVFGIYCDQYLNMARFTYEYLTMFLASVTITVNTQLPLQIICMLNTLLHIKAQVLSKCSVTQVSPDTLTEKPDTLALLSEILLSAKTVVIEKISMPLVSFLDKLSLHDPSGSIFAKLKLMMPGKLTGEDYKYYLNQTLHLLLENMIQNDFNSILVDWYDYQFQQIQLWLSTRPPFSLQTIQMESIFQLVEIVRDSFEKSTLISEGQLNSDAFNSTQDRVRMEKSRLQLISSN